MDDNQRIESRLNTGERIKADILVVGAGISGMTTAIETSEVGKEVILLERGPSIGGRIASMNQYFPKLCPPTCGLEINLRRLRNNSRVRLFTLAGVEKVSGSPGSFEVRIKVSPRYVNEKCTACGECEKVCEIERDNDFNYGLDKTKAIYLPHLMAYPYRYVMDAQFAGDERMKKCVDACSYGAIELDMQPVIITAEVGAIVWATGWKPYDASKLDNLGFGKFENVITNVMMERLASAAGPTCGRILRPSDGKEPQKIGFVQCAGSRDENHLPYCSTVCCLASMKQATYLRSRYPEAEIHLFYIDVRAPGRLEDFYEKVKQDEKIFFHRGKVGKITETADSKNLILHAENTLTGELIQYEVELAVLAVGMVPNTADVAPPLDTPLDEFGYIAPDPDTGVIGAGTVVRPSEVSVCVQDATGAAIRALTTAIGR